MARRNSIHDVLKRIPADKWKELMEWNTPATEGQIKRVNDRAIKVLGAPLSPEYLELVSLINGGGSAMAFLRTDDKVVTVFGRQMLAKNIIDSNLEYRFHEYTAADEIAYAVSECLFIQDPKTGQWFGRDMYDKARRRVFEFESFAEMVRMAYFGRDHR